VNRTRLALVAVLSSIAAFGCKSNKPSTESASATPTSQAPTAADSGAATHAGPDTRAYRSFEGSGFNFGTERRGNAIRAVYYRDSTPIDLVGEMTDETRFSLRATSARKGEKPITVVGQWSSDGSALTATLTDPQAKKTTLLPAKEGPFGDGSQARFNADFKGSLAKRFIRMKLARDGAKLTGVYRYAKSAEDITLAGSVEDKQGTFELTESVNGKVTGKFQGAFVSTSCVLATWSSPDGSRSFPIEMVRGDGYPETMDLGGGLSLYPQETTIDGMRCTRDVLYPQVRGAKDKVKEAQLNALLRGDRGKETTCDEPDPDEPTQMTSFDDESYALLTEKRGRFLSLSQSRFSYMAGAAHPNGDATCTVIDLLTLTQLRMVDFLTKQGRDKLGDRVTKELVGDGPRDDEGVYFNGDRIEIGANTNVCLTDKEIRVEFRRYEIGPYFMGEPEVTFEKGEAREVFEKSDVMDAVFAQ
jgi:hypothetical protein